MLVGTLCVGRKTPLVALELLELQLCSSTVQRHSGDRMGLTGHNHACCSAGDSTGCPLQPVLSQY